MSKEIKPPFSTYNVFANFLANRNLVQEHISIKIKPTFCSYKVTILFENFLTNRNLVRSTKVKEKRLSSVTICLEISLRIEI